MRTHSIRNNLIALGLVAAFAAAPLAQVAARDGSPAPASETVPDKASDSWITTKVISEFATTKGIHATKISVTTKDGMVTLAGPVSSEAEEVLAKKTAMKVKGVRGVSTSDLSVSTN